MPQAFRRFVATGRLMVVAASSLRFVRTCGDRIALRIAAAFWLAVTVAGQWIFAIYILSLCGSAAIRGDTAAFNTVMPHGHVPGETVINGAVAVHVLVAAILILGGPLQLIPDLRRRVPRFHRWNGRLYLATAVAVTLAGLTMLAMRGAVGSDAQDLSLAFNGVLILTCAGMALRHALARNLLAHRRWALRLFVVVGGAFFYRIGMVFWIAINHGPVGFDPTTLEGPALVALSISQYTIPLLVLEAYVRVDERGSALARHSVAGLVVVLTCVMSFAIYRAAMGMWLPHIG